MLDRVFEYVSVHRPLRENYQVRSFFWFVFSRIRTEYGKYGPEKTPYLDTFHTVDMSYLAHKGLFI